MKNWFQAFKAFKYNLCRYIGDVKEVLAQPNYWYDFRQLYNPVPHNVVGADGRVMQMHTRWGLYKLNPVDDPYRSLKGAWFPPLNLECDILISKPLLSNATCAAPSRGQKLRAAPELVQQCRESASFVLGRVVLTAGCQIGYVDYTGAVIN